MVEIDRMVETMAGSLVLLWQLTRCVVGSGAFVFLPANGYAEGDDGWTMALTL